VKSALTAKQGRRITKLLFFAIDIRLPHHDYRDRPR
jgi:hypothetical protein